MGHKLLFIEDSQTVTKAIEIALSQNSHKYDIQFASNANQALNLVSTFKPDCAIVDFTLPDSQGTELKAQLLNAGVPQVVYLVGQKNTPHFPISEEKLTKPFTCNQFIKDIEEILEAVPEAKPLSFADTPTPEQETPAAKPVFEESFDEQAIEVSKSERPVDSPFTAPVTSAPTQPINISTPAAITQSIDSIPTLSLDALEPISTQSEQKPLQPFNKSGFQDSFKAPPPPPPPIKMSKELTPEKIEPLEILSDAQLNPISDKESPLIPASAFTNKNIPIQSFKNVTPPPRPQVKTIAKKDVPTFNKRLDEKVKQMADDNDKINRSEVIKLVQEMVWEIVPLAVEETLKQKNLG